MVKNSFSSGPPFGSFWSVKYLNFGLKLPIRTAHHTFLESRHRGYSKSILCFFLKGNLKKVSAHGLIPVCSGV